MPDLTEGQKERLEKIEATYERLLAGFKATKTFTENKNDAEKFLKSLKADNIGGRRRSKYLAQFGKLCEVVKEKPFRELTAEDCEDLTIKIMDRKDYTDWTKYDYAVVLRKFFRWLDGKDDSRAEVFNPVRPEAPFIQEEKLLTREDIARMADAGELREKAVVEALYASAATEAELCDMNIEDCWWRQGALMFRIRGLKNRYRNRVIPIAGDERGYSIINQYIQNHPNRAKPKAALWLNRYGNRLEPATLSDTLESLAKKAGVTKRVNPHWFRHSKLSELGRNSSKWPEQMIKAYAGHSPDSRMMKVYCHVGTDAMLEKVLESGVGETAEFRQQEAERKLKTELENNPAKAQEFVLSLYKTGLLGYFAELAEAMGLGHYEINRGFELKNQASDGKTPSFQSLSNPRANSVKKQAQKPTCKPVSGLKTEVDNYGKRTK